MAGNELKVCRLLFESIGKEIKHLGKINSLEAPTQHGGVPITKLEDIDSLSTEDSRKKADIYVNGKGVSIKQTGGSFSYNRLQRANLSLVYTLLGFGNINEKLNKIDNEVKKFHSGLLGRRNRPWEDFFLEADFKQLLEFLMMHGSPNVGYSPNPADLIIEAPASALSLDNLFIYTFNEYFENYKKKFKIAIRRQWVGQASRSEHCRAVGLANKEGNQLWVFSDVAGEPNSGWMVGFPHEKRKTVYFLMIEKEA